MNHKTGMRNQNMAGEGGRKGRARKDPRQPRRSCVSGSSALSFKHTNKKVNTEYFFMHTLILWLTDFKKWKKDLNHMNDP